MILNPDQKPVERVLDTAFTKIRTLVDADTVIGKPLLLEDGTAIIPVSRVTMGMLTGGGEYSDVTGKSCEFPFAGGSGMGASVVPIGFLIRNAEGFKLIRFTDKSVFDKALSLIPDITEAITNAFKKDK